MGFPEYIQNLLSNVSAALHLVKIGDGTNYQFAYQITWNIPMKLAFLPQFFGTQRSERLPSKKRASQIHRYESLEIRRLLAGDTWETSFDGSLYTEVASDTAGNAIAASQNDDQIVLSKFSPNGSELWTVALTINSAGTNYGRVSSLEIDNSGQIIVAGRFEGTLDVDPGAGQTVLTTEGTDGFIASYQDTGTSLSLNWAHLIGDAVYDVALDSSSNIVAVGKFGTSLTYDSTVVSSTNTNFSQGSFLSRIASDGTLAWAQQIEDEGVFFASSVDLSAEGSIYVGGLNTTDNPDAINPHYPDVMIDGQSLPNGGDQDGYVLQFDQDNNGASFGWYYHFGQGAGGEAVNDVKVSSSGELFVLGRDLGAGDVSFAGNSYTTGGYGTATVVGKVSVVNGAPDTQWVQVIQPELDSGSTVLPYFSLDLYEGLAGNITAYVSGFFEGTIDFDPGPNEFSLTSRTPAGSLEGFLLALAGTDGALSRAWQFGAIAYSVDASADGMVHVAAFAGSNSKHLVTGSSANPGAHILGLNPEQPTVVFDPPEEIVVGDSVSIDANAYDLNNANIANSIVWTDSLGNVLGSGSTLTLSGTPVGIHTIIATATDSAGRTGSFTFDLQVNSDPIAIPDQGTLVVSKAVTLAEAVVIDDVNVTLDISHDRKDNLDVFLIAPDGTRVELFTDVGGRYGPGFISTTLDSEAVDPITNGAGNFNWTYRPEGDLSVLNGKNSEGTWSLEITDDRRRDTGTLNWWSLDISGSPAVPNDDPVITSNPTTSGTQDVAYTYDVNAADPNAGDVLTFSLDSPPIGMTIDSQTGVISWTPNNGQVGSNDVNVRVEDQLGASDTQTFTINVANVNDAPVAIDDGFATNQDTPLNVAAAGLLANDTDVDGDTLSVAQHTDPANGTVVVNSDGSFSYTPNSGFVGTDSFTYQISDGSELSNVAMVTFDVTAPSTDIALYVYDIRFESKRGNKDWRAVFEIRSDSNLNGSADSGDDAIAGVAITVRFAGEEFSGVTDSNGVFRTSWFRDLASGDYYANVDSLMASGYNWGLFDVSGEEDDEVWLNR